MTDKRHPNVSIGKDRIGKDRIGKYNPPIIPPQGNEESVFLDDVTEKGVIQNKTQKNKQKTEIDHAYDEPFNEFWEHFPRRRRNAKQECRRKYDAALKRHKGLTPQMLLDALERQKRSRDWTKDNGEYVPSPLTWLNQGRWEDDVYEGETENKGYVITEEDRLESL